MNHRERARSTVDYRKRARSTVDQRGSTVDPRGSTVDHRWITGGSPRISRCHRGARPRRAQRPPEPSDDTSGDTARAVRARESRARACRPRTRAPARRHGAAKWQRSVGERPRATHGGAALRRCESALRRGAAARRCGAALRWGRRASRWRARRGSGGRAERRRRRRRERSRRDGRRLGRGREHCRVRDAAGARPAVPLPRSTKLQRGPLARAQEQFHSSYGRRSLVSDTGPGRW